MRLRVGDRVIHEATRRPTTAILKIAPNRPDFDGRPHYQFVDGWASDRNLCYWHLYTKLWDLLNKGD